MVFNIKDYVDFDNKGRAICPCCASEGKTRSKNLALVPGSDGAYKCHRGCTPQQIREALGNPKPQQIPAALAQANPAPASKTVTVSPQKVREAHQKLMKYGESAKAWLMNRGITPEMMEHYRLGAVRSRLGETMQWSVSIPLPNPDGTAYWLKKRIAPWDEAVCNLPEYKPWSQYGIPQQVFVTHQPESPTQTWLCEGEWDAMMLGWVVRHSDLKNDIQVCCFTCGAGNVPPPKELDRMTGATVIVWYDLDDPGATGALKVAEALGQRCKIARVPSPENPPTGWDVSDALNHGLGLNDFLKAAEAAKTPQNPKAHPSGENPLRARLVWNDELMDRAPDYTDWLVDELLTADELFLLAAGPRAGKSLLAMTLAKAVAEGSDFLGRPTTQGTVIYVCLEDGEAKLKEREIAQGWSRGLPVAWMQKFKLSEIGHLRELAEELDPRLIVLDTLSRIKDSSISESSAEMSQLLEPLQEMAKDLGCCVLLVHHTGKVSVDNANAIDIFDTVRGSSAIRAVCRGTLIIAASEKNYRLLVENGWGKHDLNVVLDANTWTWRLLGQWKPGNINPTQREQIIDYLKQVGVASLEQIHEATAIPPKSLYEQLSRLQATDQAEFKVCKEGTRRRYTYRLALFNTIQQLNSVLNSENPDGESDEGGYSTKNISSLSGDQAKTAQPPVHITRNTTENSTLLNRGDQGSNPCNSEILDGADHPVQFFEGGLLLNKGDIQGSNPDTETVSSYSTDIQQYSTVEYRPPVHPPVHPPDVVRKQSKKLHRGDQGIPLLVVGDRVEILVGRFAGKPVTVVEVTADGVGVKGDSWYVTRQYQPKELKLLKQRGEADADG